jgi:GNAT superfamily N-acetyltransferase
VSDIRRLHYEEARRRVSELASVLVDCVAGGASVSFMEGYSQGEAEGFFSRVAESVGAGGRVLFAAFVDGKLVGTAQLVTDVPLNQLHRADVAKMLVHRSARGHGLGKALLAAVEAEAKAQGKTLLTLDTMSDSVAEKMYSAAGYVKAGIVPDYAAFPDGSLGPTTFFYKVI